MTSQIPGYQVIRKAGDGGMSSVYLAIQFSIGREVALKILSPELRDDPDFAERFYREANIVGALSHPNVISIYDIGKHHQHYYMAMDFLPGPSCSDLVQDDQISTRKAVNILKDIAQALSYVHQQGYLHCDVKPDNILFRKDGSAVLTDFGIARELGAKQQSIISGTPHYMSPEQAQGSKLNEASDIYSLGVLFYELLTGKPPYTGADAISVAIKHVSAAVPTLPAEFKQLQPLINKMMHKRASSRFHSADDVIEAVNYLASDILNHEVIDLPLKLKMMFLAGKIQDKMDSLSNFNKCLQFSSKHGLLYKNLNANGELADLEALSKTLAQKTAPLKNTLINTKNEACGDTAQLENDVIARAIKNKQAQVIIPGWLLYLIIGVSCLALAYPLLGDFLYGFVKQFTQPTIKYIE